MRDVAGDASKTARKNRRKCPCEEALRRITKVHFVAVHTRPFGAQTPRKVAANGRRNHHHYDEIQARAEFECRCRNA